MDNGNSCTLIYWDVNLPKILDINRNFREVEVVGRIDMFMRVRSTDAAIYSFLIEKAERENVKIFFLTRDGFFRKSAGCNNYRKKVRESVELIVLQDYRNIVPEVAAVDSMLKNELVDTIIRVLKHVLYCKQSQLMIS
ncbi:MAG: hypothetical protein UV05_C0049G0003 [candidate division CPR1 bacterium GW2011_GWA2_42_17]|uniref:Uncharacterized protein n=1 Tax=candidate division CPR1 bacterium GW2011_GWA2_42_17 TaxID=1618341 RepID=A0A0G0YZQ8_9BACT|nr:MAG: hypothetical protein UV05_C0049G0003 [candidate division CPR1 bacterium GW2011_GWA2_42_17]